MVFFRHYKRLHPVPFFPFTPTKNYRERFFRYFLQGFYLDWVLTFYFLRIALFATKVHELSALCFMRILVRGFASSWRLLEPGKSGGRYNTK